MNIQKANIKYKNTLTPLNLNNIQYIIIHHPEAKIASPEQIHEWHLQNGWSGAGYNYYIRKDGSIYEMRGDNIGAQCLGFNEISYGVCCEGNYDIETQMPQSQYNSLIELLKWLKNRFPNIQIVGHRDLNPTVCPGKYFPLQQIVNQLNNSIGGSYMNNEILQLQKDLNVLCHTGKNGQKLVEDGILGANTEYALRDFQEKNGLVVTGQYDEPTKVLLNKILRPESSPSQTVNYEEKYNNLLNQYYSFRQEVLDALANLNDVLNKYL